MDEKEPFIGVYGSRRDGTRRRLYGLVVTRAVIGVIFVAMGVLLILRNLGVIEIESLWHFWPMSLVAVGLSKVFQPRGFPGRGFGLVLVAIGAWIQLGYFGILPFRAKYFLPVIFIVIGMTMLWRGVAGVRPPGLDGVHRVGMSPVVEIHPSGDSARSQEASSNDTINVVAVLGGVEHRNSSQDFQGGNVSAILGGCDLDLRKASIAGNQAVLDVLAFWGGVEIKVPEDWTVNVKGTPVLGSFNDRTHPPREGATKTLIVQGAAIMGGVEIKN